MEIEPGYQVHFLRLEGLKFFRSRQEFPRVDTARVDIAR